MMISAPGRMIYKLSYLFLFAGIAALYPYIPLVLQGKGFSPSRVGFILGAYEVFSMSGLLVLGQLYDSFRSPKRTMIVLNLIALAFLYAVAATENVILLIPLTLALGFFVKSPTSLMDAHFGQTHPGRPELYGRTRLYGSLGFFLFAMLIQITGLVEGGKPMTVFLGYSIPLLITSGLIVLLPASPHNKEASVRPNSFRTSIRQFPRIYWAGLVIVFLNYTGFSGHYTFFSLLLHNRFGMDNIGALWAIGPLFEIPLFFFSGFLLNKLGEKGLWMISLVSCTIRLLVYGMAESVLPLYIVQILHSPCFSFNHLAMVSLINHHTREENRGLAMSLNAAVGMGLSLFTGGILGGIILKYSGFTLLFRLFTLFPLTGMVLLLLMGKSEKQTQNRRERA